MTNHFLFSPVDRVNFLWPALSTNLYCCERIVRDFVLNIIIWYFPLLTRHIHQPFEHDYSRGQWSMTRWFGRHGDGNRARSELWLRSDCSVDGRTDGKFWTELAARRTRAGSRLLLSPASGYPDWGNWRLCHTCLGSNHWYNFQERKGNQLTSFRSGCTGQSKQACTMIVLIAGESNSVLIYDVQ